MKVFCGGYVFFFFFRLESVKVRQFFDSGCGLQVVKFSFLWFGDFFELGLKIGNQVIQILMQGQVVVGIGFQGNCQGKWFFSNYRKSRGCFYFEFLLQSFEVLDVGNYWEYRFFLDFARGRRYEGGRLLREYFVLLVGLLGLQRF